MKESAIQKKILDYLDAKGCYTVKIISANKNGVADILCSYRGRFVALEVKTDKGVVSEMQKFQISEVIKSGGHAAVVRSVVEVRQLIDELNSEHDEWNFWRERNNDT